MKLSDLIRSAVGATTVSAVALIIGSITNSMNRPPNEIAIVSTSVKKSAENLVNRSVIFVSGEIEA